MNDSATDKQFSEQGASGHMIRNPFYHAPGTNPDYVRKHHATMMAYEVSGLLKTSWLAINNEDATTEDLREALGASLDLARNIMGNLIEAVEVLEEQQSRAAKTSSEGD